MARIGTAAPDKSDITHLILLYSEHEKLRNILAAGLRQFNTQVIEIEAERMATIKANQYRPNLMIVDLGEHTYNLKIIIGLNKSPRTKGIPTVVIGTAKMIPAWESFLEKMKLQMGKAIEEKVEFVVFPFKFAGLLAPVQDLLQVKFKPKKQVDETSDVDLQNMPFNPDIASGTKLDHIAGMLKKQWAFPYTAHRALQIANSDLNGCRDLGKCIKTDSSATSSILKVANTVFYAKSAGKFKDVTQAVVRLGFKETRNLLSSMALINMSPGPDKNYGFSRKEFWLHSLASGVIADHLCRKAPEGAADLAFTIGLLHDLGKVPLDNNFEAVFPKVLDKTTSDICPFYKAERELMGFNHADLGRFLMEQWNFPETISFGVFNHHNPDAIYHTRRAEDRVVFSCVYMANIIAKALNLGYSCDQILPEIPKSMLKEMKIPDGPGEDFFDKIMRELEILLSYIKITQNGLELRPLWGKKHTSRILVVADELPFFHPILLALKNEGFKIKKVTLEALELETNVRIVFFFSENAQPYQKPAKVQEDGSALQDSGSTDDAVLQVFFKKDLGNVSKEGKPLRPLAYMSRSEPDYRLVQQTLLDFLEEHPESEQEEDESIPEEHAEDAEVEALLGESGNGGSA